MWGDAIQPIPGGHCSVCHRHKRGPLSLECSYLHNPTPGPQHCPRKNLRELLRGPCALGRPHSQLPSQIARLISTRCPEDQSRKASPIRAGFLCSAAHGGFSFRINDRQTPWPLSCFIFSCSASFSFFSPYLRAPMFIPSTVALSPQSRIVWRAFKMYWCWDLMPRGSD